MAGCSARRPEPDSSLKTRHQTVMPARKEKFECKEEAVVAVTEKREMVVGSQRDGKQDWCALFHRLEGMATRRGDARINLHFYT